MEPVAAGSGKAAALGCVGMMPIRCGLVPSGHHAIMLGALVTGMCAAGMILTQIVCGHVCCSSAAWLLTCRPARNWQLLIRSGCNVCARHMYSSYQVHTIVSAAQ